MTHEEKLKSIIQAQVKGGCEEYSFWIKESLWNLNNGEICMNGSLTDFDSILRILLDTQGCKAAYGDGQTHQPNEHLLWKRNSGYILEAWHSKEGNNWKASIDVAYDLLDG